MKFKQVKAGIALLLCLTTVGSALPIRSRAASEDPAEEPDRVSSATELSGCAEDRGTNADGHDYQNWAKPSYSYLTKISDGQWMRFQADLLEGAYLIEYYTSDGRLERRLQVEEELPLFGAFYATDTHYYVFSGKENPSEDPRAECFRLTRYDREWVKDGVVRVTDCNTTIPFYASGVSITHSGRWLFVRTGHQMYRSEDGVCHQANITFQFDVVRMYLSDSFAGVLNSDFGYVSHSFNQFVRIENDRLIAVDHGDMYPRSIQLTSYTADISTGRFFSRCQTDDLVQLPMGMREYTYTGASVGGFEISASAYLTAYNSVAQDGNFSSNVTRNIYIAALDKATGQVKRSQITHIPEGKGSASTPYLVKLTEDDFLLLWSVDNTVYYTALNGAGEQVGNIFAMRDSKLSDCAPMVTDTHVVWYLQNQSEITFYQIDHAVLARNDSFSVCNHHQWEVSSYPQTAGGQCVQVCCVCGKERSFATASSITVWWNDEGENGRYYPWLRKTEYQLGERLYLWVDYTDAEFPAEEMILQISDPRGCSFTATQDDMGYLAFTCQGEYEITLCSRFNSQVKVTFKVKVCNPFYVEGDVDGNGKADQHDLTVLRNYLAGIDLAVEWDALDVNRDGAVNMRDVAALVQLLPN